MDDQQVSPKGKPQRLSLLRGVGASAPKWVNLNGEIRMDKI